MHPASLDCDQIVTGLLESLSVDIALTAYMHNRYAWASTAIVAATTDWRGALLDSTHASFDCSIEGVNRVRHSLGACLLRWWQLLPRGSARSRRALQFTCCVLEGKLAASTEQLAQEREAAEAALQEMKDAMNAAATADLAKLQADLSAKVRADGGYNVTYTCCLHRKWCRVLIKIDRSLLFLLLA